MTRNVMHTALLSVALTALLASTINCSQDPGDQSFSEDVGAAFAPCNPAEIRFLAGKHNFMPAFKNCGSNNFKHYSWSPNGTHLYFQFELAAHIMDAEAADKRVITVPTETPAGRAGWLNSSRLAIPLSPAEDSDVERIAVFDIDQNSLFEKSVPGLTEVSDLHVGAGPSQLYFTALKNDVRGIYEINLDDGTISEPFPFITEPVVSFTYSPRPERAVVGFADEEAGGVVKVFSREGTEIGAWSPATRGALQAEGRWLALEHKGQEVSIFYQRSWDELSDNARARELARAEKFEEKLPAHFPRTVQPPTISVVDLVSEERWMFTGIQGHHLQWYDARPYYISAILWGFEGKEFNRNIVLGNLADRLHSIEKGEEMLGVQRFGTEVKSGSAEAMVDREQADNSEPNTGAPNAEPSATAAEAPTPDASSAEPATPAPTDSE